MMIRKSVKDVLDNPKIDEAYILVTRYYPIECRIRKLKLKDTPFAYWERKLAPSKELLSDVKKGKIGWEEYVRRFKEEHPIEIVKRILEPFEGVSKRYGKKIVLVCEEDDSKYPQCHTWILLDMMKQEK